MSRRKQGFIADEDEGELDISSLIDVCFLLLIYFMVTATIQPREADLGLSLPSKGQPSSAPDIPPMLIEVQDDGSIVVNKEEYLDSGFVGKKRHLPQLEGRLEIYRDGAKAAGQDPVVQVAVKSEAPQQSVVDVINSLRGLNIEKVSFTDLSNN